MTVHHPGQPGDGAAARIAAERDRLAVRRLLRSHRRYSGRWRMPTGEAWQPALAVDAVVNTYQRTRERRYLRVIERSFARYRGRRSRYHDDDGWYLNAWLRAYDVTGEPAYLHEAQALFAAMADGWDEVCRGGLWWSADRGYKNAITNELFLLSAARLHRRVGSAPGGVDYRGWALREWDWFDASGMINSDHLVNDGLDASCANNGGVTWSYNQGVILGGLVELWRITGDDGHLAPARQIADAAIERLTDAGSVLKEPGEPERCTGDALMFKGIFAQGLCRLYDADRASRPAYWTFLNVNADAVWRAGRDRCDRIGPHWAGPPTSCDGATQASACLLLGGVALLHSGGETAPVATAG